jgi:alanine racemase
VPGLGEAVVDLAAVAHNTGVFARALGPRALMAVVKADGFGHGAIEVARTALQHGASWLGVTSSTEALALRAAGIEAPVLMWIYLPDADLEEVLAAGIHVSASSGRDLDLLAEQAARVGVVAQVHLKADTGFTRAGAPVDEWPRLVAWARKYELSDQVKVRGVWSHLGTADEPDSERLAAQLAAFENAVAVALGGGLEPEFRHLANSAAALARPEAHFDLARIGIGLYGVEPVVGQRFGLRPALTLRSSVMLTKRVPPGTEVSYGHDWRSSRSTTLALVPLGFADGVPRYAGPRASVWVHGVRCPIAGRITMDQLVLDVGDLPVMAGDPVVIFGPGDQGEPTVEEWAQWAETNPHEVLTGISNRVPRRYLPSVSTGSPA